MCDGGGNHLVGSLDLNNAWLWFILLKNVKSFREGI